MLKISLGFGHIGRSQKCYRRTEGVELVSIIDINYEDQDPLFRL